MLWISTYWSLTYFGLLFYGFVWISTADPDFYAFMWISTHWLWFPCIDLDFRGCPQFLMFGHNFCEFALISMAWSWCLWFVLGFYIFFENKQKAYSRKLFKFYVLYNNKGEFFTRSLSNAKFGIIVARSCRVSAMQCQRLGIAVEHHNLRMK